MSGASRLSIRAKDVMRVRVRPRAGTTWVGSLIVSASSIARRVAHHRSERGTLPVLASCADWAGRWVAGLPAAGRPGRPFVHDGRSYRALRHRYHYTWLNERAVELALAQAVVADADPARTLEVGNVLAHYGPVRHLVVDKYEPAPHVLNQDVVDVDPGRPLDLVLSVSTLEHVGFDEPEPDPDKPRRVVEHLASLLSPGGRLWATVPVGYNRGFDVRLRAGELGFTRLTALRRVSAANDWAQVDVDEVWDAAYDRLLATAHGLVVAELVSPSA
jgi:SAM-dependent methyltransferase